MHLSCVFGGWAQQAGGWGFREGRRVFRDGVGAAHALGACTCRQARAHTTACGISNPADAGGWGRAARAGPIGYLARHDTTLPTTFTTRGKHTRSALHMRTSPRASVREPRSPVGGTRTMVAHTLLTARRGACGVEVRVGVYRMCRMRRGMLTRRRAHGASESSRRREGEAQPQDSGAPEHAESARYS